MFEYEIIGEGARLTVMLKILCIHSKIKKMSVRCDGVGFEKNID